MPLIALEAFVGLGLLGWGFYELWSLRRDRRRSSRPDEGSPPQVVGPGAGPPSANARVDPRRD